MEAVHVCYRLLRRSLCGSEAGVAPCGFAYQDHFAADSGRGAEGHGFVALPPSFGRLRFRVWTDGSCVTNPGTGGWAYLVEDHAGRLFGRCTGGVLQATNNQMELRAVIAAIEHFQCSSIVDLFTDSRYVCWGLQRLADWQSDNWVRATVSELRNGHLWRRLAILCGRHEVHWHWVRAHAADGNNRTVDRMASQAADQHNTNN